MVKKKLLKRQGFKKREIFTEEERQLRDAIKMCSHPGYKESALNLIEGFKHAIRQQYTSRVAKIFKRNFAYPFLPDGFVDVFFDPEFFRLRIGRRDVEILLDGTLGGSGTLLGSPWLIIKDKDQMIKPYMKKKRKK